MSQHAQLLMARVRETFYAYSNRKTSDNRSAQVTLGPSEIGTQCDRRLALHLLGVSAVNPGGDGWAAFVGTCTHDGMAQVYEWANAGTGRYAVEMPVTLPSDEVPRGTTDLHDRVEKDIVDWKVMGDYALKKFKAEGPSETYRVQAQTYGLGAVLGGEKVKNVAVVGLPRAGRSLTEAFAWSEPFDRKVGEAALDRVRKIGADVRRHQEERATWAGLDLNAHALKIGAEFDIVPDSYECRYCPFFMKGDTDMVKGCPGA